MGTFQRSSVNSMSVTSSFSGLVSSQGIPSDAESLLKIVDNIPVINIEPVGVQLDGAGDPHSVGSDSSGSSTIHSSFGPVAPTAAQTV